METKGMKIDSMYVAQQLLTEGLDWSSEAILDRWWHPKYLTVDIVVSLALLEFKFNPKF